MSTDAARSDPGVSRPAHRYVRPPAPLYFPSEESVPETALHLRLRTGLFLILEHGLAGRAFVGSDQFVYWDPTDPQACLAPDAFVRLGGPAALLPSYKTWEHGAPHVAVEIVSQADSRDSDFAQKLARYRRCGVAEVVRFDPENPLVPLRIWDFMDSDLIERDPTEPSWSRCDALGAFWCVVPDAVLGSMLRLADTRDGAGLWLTREEAALRRVAELEAELKRTR